MTEKAEEMDNGKVPSVFKRRLDIASKASIDIVSLNNVIVKMRPKIHASKMIVIAKLRDVVKKLKNQKGTDNRNKKNEKKALDREKEIDMIKALNNDHVSKFAIGSTEKLDTVSSRPGVSLEQIALVRLASHKYIQDVVQDFRKNHQDWKELGAYLMTKHTNREFKKKKKKPDRLSMQMKELKRLKTKANVEASERMVKSYLNEKLRNEDIGSDTESDKEDVIMSDRLVGSDSDEGNSEREDKDTENSGNDEDNDGNETKSEDNFNCGSEYETDSDDNKDTQQKKQKSPVLKSANKKIVERDNKKMDKSKIKDENKNTNIKTKDTDDSKKKSSSAKKDTTSKKDNTLKNPDKVDDPKKQKESTNKNKKSVLEKPKSKPISLEKVQGEIIVKKLNLEEWCKSDQPVDNGKVPEILLANEDTSKTEVKEKKVKSKKKKRDPFFDTGENLFQSRDSKPGELGKNLLTLAGCLPNGNPGSEKTDNSSADIAESDTDEDSDDVDDDEDDDRNMVVDDYDYIFNEKSRRDGSVYMKANNMGKQAFRSTFMQSLSSSGMKDKRKNLRQSERDKLKKNKFQDKDFDGKRSEKTVSAGTKAKLKKKGMFQLRESGQGELGNSLLTIAGYDKAGSKVEGSGTDTGTEKRLSEMKGDYCLRRNEDFKTKKVKPTKPDKNAIHPSWEASMKRKQQQSLKVEFSGKKIKFDDD